MKRSIPSDHDDAVAWIARLRADDVSDADRDRFDAWLADDRHRREFVALLALWNRLSCVERIASRH